MKDKSDGKDVQTNWAAYYDRHGILDQIAEGKVDLSMDEDLRISILEGKRMHKLQSVTLKLDPVQVQAIKKLATMKSMPYQTLIRHWLAKELKQELHLAAF